MEEVKKEQQEEGSMVIDLGSIDTQRLFVGGERQSLYVNSLSSREMESLTAICDTLFPSVYGSNMMAAAADDGYTNSISSFYRSSASMAGTPQRVGGLFCERVQHPKKWLIRLTLYVLSTWIGTFILCGLASMSPSFPFFLRFSQISQSKRERILLSWSTSFFYLLRMLFKS